MVMSHTFIHEQAKKFIDGFRHDAHPMGMFLSTVAALSTFFKEGKDIFDERNRLIQFHRMVAKMPTIAAFCYRHSIGMPFAYPDNDLSYSGNFLNMMFKKTEVKYKPNPVLERALDVLFILHADHEQNCSTTSMRAIGSSHCDPFTALAGAAAALVRPAARRSERSGAANAGGDRIEGQCARVHPAGEGGRRQAADGLRAPGVQELRPAGADHQTDRDGSVRGDGKNPLLDLALELERIALEDDYFVKRKLYPNVDFYSGLIYQAMKFPTEMFPVLFAIPRTPGWLSQWEEQILDPDQKIARPRQVYLGEDERAYVPMEERGA
jgi:citrate synthase